MDAISTADKPISRAATTCRLPKRELADVSLPERQHANQPNHADKKGKALPTDERVKPIVYTIPRVHGYQQLNMGLATMPLIKKEAIPE